MRIDSRLKRIDASRHTEASDALDATHLVTILAGATTWYATSSHLLGRTSAEAAIQEEDYTSYRDQLMRVTRFLLGTLPKE